MSTESPLTEHHLCRRHGAGFLHIYCLLESVFSLALVHDQSDSLRPPQLQPARLFRTWDSPGKNTGVGCHALLQGIFLTQGSNPMTSVSPVLFTNSAIGEAQLIKYHCPYFIQEKAA